MKSKFLATTGLKHPYFYAHIPPQCRSLTRICLCSLSLLPPRCPPWCSSLPQLEHVPHPSQWEAVWSSPSNDFAYSFAVMMLGKYTLNSFSMAFVACYCGFTTLSAVSYSSVRGQPSPCKTCLTTTHFFPWVHYGRCKHCLPCCMTPSDGVA